ncbi:MAG: mannitol dehydrogenase family protein [Lachnospirales bacterium]
MAKLCVNDLSKIENLGIEVPKFDIEKVKEATLKNPEWLHFGAGNIFRILVGNTAQKAIEKGKISTGIIAIESFDKEIIDKVYTPFDNLTLSVTLKSTGEFVPNVTAGIVHGITTDEYDEMTSYFVNPSLKIVSFTITEKGYALTNANGEFFPFVEVDFTREIEKASHVMSIVTAMLYKRFKANATPITLLSMDNCSHNGDKVKLAVQTIAKKWFENGMVDENFITYVEENVSYPLSMIDKITPRPNDSVKEELEKMGLENMDTIVTSKNTYTAPFVNAEEVEYLIIEDNFKNGKLDFSNDRVIFTDRDTVNNVEIMKVTTCLNPLHTALAVTGCLLQKEFISDEMEDETLVKLVKKIGYDEGLKVVLDPEIINPKDFIDEVVNIRFPNPYVKDMPQRIATDTSQKVGIRFGETIKKYGDNAKDLVGIPLAIASWLRYLIGLNDDLEKMEISPDPMLTELQGIVSKVKIGDTDFDVSSILSNEKIFGLNLYNVGLGQNVEKYFGEMISKKGAVIDTLKKYL